MIEDKSLTIFPIIGWSIIGNIAGYIVHKVFGKDTDEEITAPANPIQNQKNTDEEITAQTNAMAFVCAVISSSVFFWF